MVQRKLIQKRISNHLFLIKNIKVTKRAICPLFLLKNAIKALQSHIKHRYQININYFKLKNTQLTPILIRQPNLKTSSHR